MTDEMTEFWPKKIAETAFHLTYPPTPDIAAAVQQWQRPRASAGLLRRAAVAVVLLVLLLAGLLAIPPVRAAVREWLRIGAIEVFIVEEVPVVKTAVPLSIIDLGEPMSLAEAQKLFPEPLGLPPGWDASGVVYMQQFLGDLPAVSIQWQTADQVTVTLSQIAAPYLGAKWASGERVVETAVHEEMAIWIEGVHPLQFETGDFDTQIIVENNVLIWTEGSVTYRLEGQLSQAEAVQLAESLP